AVWNAVRETRRPTLVRAAVGNERARLADAHESICEERLELGVVDDGIELVPTQSPPRSSKASTPPRNRRKRPSHARPKRSARAPSSASITVDGRGGLLDIPL